MGAFVHHPLYCARPLVVEPGFQPLFEVSGLASCSMSLLSTGKSSSPTHEMTILCAGEAFNPTYLGGCQ